MMNTQHFINVWIENDHDLQQSFESPYKYALYLCGGDFTQFDDLPKLIEFFDKSYKHPCPVVKLVPLHGDMANQFNESQEFEEDDDLPY